MYAALPSPYQGSVGEDVFGGSKVGLSGPANPPSPVSKGYQNASLESPVVILPGVSAAEKTKKGKTTATNSIGQGWLSRQRMNLMQTMQCTKCRFCCNSGH